MARPRHSRDDSAFSSNGKGLNICPVFKSTTPAHPRPEGDGLTLAQEPNNGLSESDLTPFGQISKQNISDHSRGNYYG